MVFCVHGAGHSALSFAVLAKEVKTFGILAAYDIKGHGSSQNKRAPDDFSCELLLNEAKEALVHMSSKFPKPTIVILGHSLGGALASKLAFLLNQPKEQTNRDSEEISKRLVGLIVLDMFEQKALSSIKEMAEVISRRPKTFSSISKAIEWVYLSFPFLNSWEVMNWRLSCSLSASSFDAVLFHHPSPSVPQTC